MLHLSQAGRLDIEEPPKKTKPRGSVARFVFGHGRRGLDGDAIGRPGARVRHAAQGVVVGAAPGDEGPLAGLGPEPGSEAFAAFIRTSDSNRHLTTDLRDQHVVSGIGRGWGDDILHRAKLSPFASLRSLSPTEREDLLGRRDRRPGRGTRAGAERQGGLSEAKLGGRFSARPLRGALPDAGATTRLRGCRSSPTR